MSDTTYSLGIAIAWGLTVLVVAGYLLVARKIDSNTVGGLLAFGIVGGVFWVLVLFALVVVPTGMKTRSLVQRHIVDRYFALPDSERIPAKDPRE